MKTVLDRLDSWICGEFLYIKTHPEDEFKASEAFDKTLKQLRKLREETKNFTEE